MPAHTEPPPQPFPALPHPQGAASTAAPWQSMQRVYKQLGAPAAALGAALAGPRLCRAWAHMLVMHWSRLERLGGLDLAQPLYVLDLAPHAGHLAAGVLRELREAMHAHGMLGWPVRYVLCPPHTDGTAIDLASLLQHPGLQAFFASGWLDYAVWQGRTGHPLLVGQQRFALFGSRNPVVALSAGGFSNMPSELYAVHFGQLHLAQVQIHDDAAVPQNHRLEYAWEPVAPDAALDTGQAVLLNHYCASLIAAAVYVSEPSLALLDALADFSAGRYLLLAADQGQCHEQQLRMNAMAPPDTVLQGELRLPVNFHALAMHQKANGAQVANLQWDPMDCVLHMACRDDVQGVDPATWQSLVDWGDHAHPAERWWHGAAEAAPPDLNAMNFRLRESGGDPWTLSAILQQLDPQKLETDSAIALAASHANLARIWRYMPPEQRKECQPNLLSLLCHLGDWPLAHTVLEHPVDTAEWTPAQRAQWQWSAALVNAATGHSARAEQQLRRTLRTATPNANLQPLEALCAQLQERLAHWQAHDWYDAERLRDGPLALEPLDALHIPQWLHQFRDPTIAAMAGLPELADATDARAYLAYVAGQQGAEYAVVHAEHGLVGAVGLRCLEDMAHLHFWIGVDHQGLGLGRQVLQLLLRYLPQTGLRLAFATALKSNIRSRRLLERCGFAQMDCAVGADDEAYVFMYLPLAPIGTQVDLPQRLRRMCVAIGEPLAEVESTLPKMTSASLN